MINTAWGIACGFKCELRLSYNFLNICVVSESAFELAHFLTSENFLPLRELISSPILTSSSEDSIPVSILPLTEYLCSSFNTLRKSGKCFMINSAITFFSYSILFRPRISEHFLRYNSPIFFFSFTGIVKSKTAQREWMGSIIRLG